MNGRSLEIDGAQWLAWPSGGGAYGTGVYSLGSIEAVHFATAEAPEVPLFEALLPAGTFWGLFDEELAGLFRTARRVVEMSDAPERPVSRRLGDQS